MIVSCHGSRFYGGQIDRIELGFLQLGHALGYIIHNEPDLIYCNDAPHYTEAIEKWLFFNKRPKLILNILDVPHWLPEWPKIKQEWLPKLSYTNKVTCISKTVQKDIKRYLDIDAEVIYNPIKLVNIIPNTTKDIVALFVGRALAPNKRVKELILPLYRSLIPDFGANCIHFVGSENTGFGVNHGIVADKELNLLYNRSIFTLIPSLQEGLNLPLLESLCAGSLPIVCRDMSTALEFSPEFCLCEPTPQDMLNKMKELSYKVGATNEYDMQLSTYTKIYSEKFSPKSIASNIVLVYNSL